MNTHQKVSTSLRQLIFSPSFVSPILLPALVTSLEAWSSPPKSRTRALVLHFDLLPSSAPSFDPLTSFTFRSAVLTPFTDLQPFLTTVQRTTPGINVSSALGAIEGAKKVVKKGELITLAFFAVVRLPAELGGGETGCWGGLGWQEPNGWNEKFVEKDWEGQLKAGIEKLRRENAPRASKVKEVTPAAALAKDQCHACRTTVPPADLLQCSRCKNAVYCSAACQGKAWKEHKGSCKAK
ncbi:hypothetical protein BCR35DRAFT_355545 [Leucosporidium creatinivorum]|uniref:MYND-type domain-containing protein n=1 Tax=Leucosporidium creatinivorum TaxID=106004 RepID=A0A1Y2DBZ1_9BASI|nr:hypothetical protein BCR35DRAFT_355545 [Leucosporidium creatinivorum]